MIDQGQVSRAEHLPRLTERFYRIDVASSREKGGTGLGLAIVKHILNRHRGELAITSSPGKGSTFTVVLDSFAGTERSGALSTERKYLKPIFHQLRLSQSGSYLS